METAEVIAFVGTVAWEKSACRLVKKAQDFLKADFGNRLMVWSEMANILNQKEVPQEYLLGHLSQSLGNFQDLIDLFNAEIKGCLTTGKDSVMDSKIFDTYLKATSQISIRDHRILNPESPQKRREIRQALLGSWEGVS